LLDGRSGELRPAARATGTTVEVKELFFSTPARRKFLKTDATELAHCIEAVRRHALARPEVGFAIWHEGKLVEQWRARAGRAGPAPGRRAGQRAAGIHRQSVAVDEVPGRAAAGHGPRRHPRRRALARRPAVCYVNGRYVRDKVLTHAARSAYEDVLHGHRQPVYALYVEMDPARVDVNVHPTKIEVRFRDSREVHQAVRHAVENALAAPRARSAAAPPRWPANTGADPQKGHDFSRAAKSGAAYAPWSAPQAQAAQPAIKFEAYAGHRVEDLAAVEQDALWQPTEAQPSARGETQPAASPSGR
jgi:DNA mismatch repair protein MutL